VADRFVRSFTAHDTVTLTSTQAFHDTTDTYQGAFGGKWDSGPVKITGEVSYNISTVKTKGVILDMAITSPTQALAISYNDGDALTVKASGVDYTDGNNYWLTQFYDQWSRVWSGQYAVRSDVLVRLDRSFLRTLQFGVRYSERDVHFHSANGGGDFQWHAAAASSIPGMGRESPSQPFLSADQFSIRQFWSPDPAWLLNNPDTVRGVFHHALGDPPADLARTFTDTEKTFAVYGLANYKFDLGGLPLEGVIGARFADTHQSLGGYQHVILANGASGAGFERTLNDKASWEVLPTWNGRLHVTDKLLFRYSLTKTETRPDFAALNPALTLTQPTMTLPGIGSGGNPDLNPIKSTNYDASFEYYFSKTTQASVVGFYRSIDGYIQSYGSEETINGGFYTVTRPRNTHNGYLHGIEASYQQFFDFLPDAFKGLGFQLNYTYIKGQTENPLTGIKQDIAQVSKANYNIILIYEKGPFSSRLAYNWRGKYIESFNQSGLQPTTVWVQPTKRLDFSASYAIGKSLTITFDATNILRSKYHDNFGNVPMFSRDVRNYDATYEVGVRYRY
jgi:TonB-dependent receptor